MFCYVFATDNAACQCKLSIRHVQCFDITNEVTTNFGPILLTGKAGILGKQYMFKILELNTGAGPTGDITIALEKVSLPARTADGGCCKFVAPVRLTGLVKGAWKESLQMFRGSYPMTACLHTKLA